MWRITASGLVVLLLMVGGCQGFRYSHHLKFVPDDMDVWQRTYVSEKAWGFGPGGNETGIIVYVMPGVVKSQLAEDGIAYLEGLGVNSWDGWQGRYGDWSSTPIDPSTGEWADPERCPTGVSDYSMLTYPQGCPSITGYLGRYGFNIPVRDDVERMATEALFLPGAYYAFGRIGLIILIPQENRIVYAYSG